MTNREVHVVEQRTGDDATYRRRPQPEAEGVDGRRQLSLTSTAESRRRRQTVLLVADDYRWMTTLIADDYR